MTENRQNVSSATELAYWRLIANRRVRLHVTDIEGKTYGENLACASGVISYDVCGSGRNKDCKVAGSDYSHTGKCAGIEVTDDCTEAQTKTFAGLTCTPGRFMKSFCSSGENDDCSGQRIKISCCKAKCEAGSYFAATSGSCTSCPAGRYGDGEAACEDCTLGRYGTGGSTTSQCDGACKPGSYSIGGAVDENCIACPAGSITNKGPGAGAWTAGSITNKGPSTGATTCTACAKGRYSTASNVAACTPCPKGYISNNSPVTFCVSCVRGKYVAQEAQTVCSACAAGKYGINNTDHAAEAAHCVACAVGRFSIAEGSTACTACPDNHFYVDSSTTCGTCPSGYHYDSEHNERFGFYVCDRCSAGRFQSSSEQGSCDSCPVGYYQDETTQQECKACPEGYKYHASAGQACVRCPPGYYQPAAAQQECNSCPAGKFQNSALPSTGCAECAKGMYQSANSSSSCAFCRFFEDKNTGAVLPGEYQNLKGQASCKSCPASSMEQNGQQKCETCNAGKYSKTIEEEKCYVCPKGKYSDREKATSCQMCKPGQFAARNNTKLCEVCPVGYAQPDNTSDTCVPCKIGFFAASKGLLSCLACGKGKFAEEQKATECNDCVPGMAKEHVGAHPNASCAFCVVGKYSRYHGSIKCDDCRDGQYSNKVGSSICQKCPLGKHQPETKQTDCVACAVGRYSIPHADSDCENCTDCTDCATGEYVNATSALVCAHCPAGRFQDQPRAINCKDCNAGFHQPMDRSAKCERCEVGRYQSDNAKTACDACPAGTFQDKEQQTFCKACTPGKISPAASNKSCVACGAGKYEVNNERCDDCPIGKYTDPAAGKVHKQGCDDCPSGYHGVEESRTQCTQCTVGRYQSVVGQPSCLACMQGRYNERVGMKTEGDCLQCPRNSITFGNASSNLTQCQCDVHYYRCHWSFNTADESCVSLKEMKDASYATNDVHARFGQCVRCSDRKCEETDINCEPEGMDCDKPGSTLRDLKLKPGFWRPAIDTIKIYPCKGNDNINSSSTKCGGGLMMTRKVHAQVVLNATNLAAVCPRETETLPPTPLHKNCKLLQDTVHDTFNAYKLGRQARVVHIWHTSLDLEQPENGGRQVHFEHLVVDDGVAARTKAILSSPTFVRDLELQLRRHNTELQLPDNSQAIVSGPEPSEPEQLQPMERYTSLCAFGYKGPKCEVCDADLNFVRKSGLAGKCEQCNPDDQVLAIGVLAGVFFGLLLMLLILWHAGMIREKQRQERRKLLREALAKGRGRGSGREVVLMVLKDSTMLEQWDHMPRMRELEMKIREAEDEDEEIDDDADSNDEGESTKQRGASLWGRRASSAKLTSKMDAQKAKQKTMEATVMHSRLSRYNRNARDYIVKFKIFLTLVQCLVRVGTVFRIPFPFNVEWFFSWFNVFSFDFLSFIQLRCIGGFLFGSLKVDYFFTLYAYTISPLVVCFLLVFFSSMERPPTPEQAKDSIFSFLSRQKVLQGLLTDGRCWSRPPQGSWQRVRDDALFFNAFSFVYVLLCIALYPFLRLFLDYLWPPLRRLFGSCFGGNKAAASNNMNDDDKRVRITGGPNEHYERGYLDEVVEEFEDDTGYSVKVVGSGSGGKIIKVKGKYLTRNLVQKPILPKYESWLAILFITFAIYPSNTSRILEYFDCFQFEDGFSYMQADDTIVCKCAPAYTAAQCSELPDGGAAVYESQFKYIITLIVVYPVGIPLFYFIVLLANLTRIREEHDTASISLEKGAAAGAKRLSAGADKFEAVHAAGKAAKKCLAKPEDIRQVCDFAEAMYETQHAKTRKLQGLPEPLICNPYEPTPRVTLKVSLYRRYGRWARLWHGCRGGKTPAKQESVTIPLVPIDTTIAELKELIVEEEGRFSPLSHTMLATVQRELSGARRKRSGTPGGSASLKQGEYHPFNLFVKGNGTLTKLKDYHTIEEHQLGGDNGLEIQAETTAPEPPSKGEQKLGILARASQIVSAGLSWIGGLAKSEEVEQYEFLFVAYKPSCWWAEVVDMLRRGLLIGVPMILGGQNMEIYQLPFGIGIVLASISYFNWIEPYLDWENNVLMVLTQYELFITLFAGLLLKFDQDIGRVGGRGDMYGSEAMGLIIIYTNIIVFTIVAGAYASIAAFLFAGKWTCIARTAENLCKVVDEAELVRDETIKSPPLSEWLSLVIRKGQVIVGSVGQDSPADKAGLLPGDVLVTVNSEPLELFEKGKEIEHAKALMEWLEINGFTDTYANGKPKPHKAGQPRGQPRKTLCIGFWRKKQEVSDKLRRKLRRKLFLDGKATSRLGEDALSSYGIELGVDLEQADGSASKKLWVTVTAVETGQLADQAGLLEGDRLMKVGDFDCTTTEQMSEGDAVKEAICVAICEKGMELVEIEYSRRVPQVRHELHQLAIAEFLPKLTGKLGSIRWWLVKRWLNLSWTLEAQEKKRYRESLGELRELQRWAKDTKWLEEKQEEWDASRREARRTGADADADASDNASASTGAEAEKFTKSPTFPEVTSKALEASRVFRVRLAQVERTPRAKAKAKAESGQEVSAEKTEIKQVVFKFRQQGIGDGGGPVKVGVGGSESRSDGEWLPFRGKAKEVREGVWESPPWVELPLDAAGQQRGRPQYKIGVFVNGDETPLIEKDVVPMKSGSGDSGPSQSRVTRTMSVTQHGRRRASSQVEYLPTMTDQIKEDERKLEERLSESGQRSNGGEAKQQPQGRKQSDADDDRKQEEQVMKKKGKRRLSAYEKHIGMKEDDEDEDSQVQQQEQVQEQGQAQEQAQEAEEEGASQEKTGDVNEEAGPTDDEDKEAPEPAAVPEGNGDNDWSIDVSRSSSVSTDNESKPAALRRTRGNPIKNKVIGGLKKKQKDSWWSSVVAARKKASSGTSAREPPRFDSHQFEATRAVFEGAADSMSSENPMFTSNDAGADAGAGAGAGAGTAFTFAGAGAGASLHADADARQKQKHELAKAKHLRKSMTVYGGAASKRVSTARGGPVGSGSRSGPGDGGVLAKPNVSVAVV
eukprot:g260.t1